MPGYLIREYREACALWRRGNVRSDARTPVSVPVLTLLVSGYFDPVTPPEFGDRVARSLPVSRHIVAPTGAHGSVSGCPRAAALHILTKATLDGLPDVCRP